MDEESCPSAIAEESGKWLGWALSSKVFPLEMPLVAFADGSRKAEKNQLHQPGASLDTISGRMVNYQQRLRPSLIAGIPNRGMDAHAAPQETGAGTPKSHNV